MKLPLLLAMAVLIGAPELQAEPRVFTNAEGRSVKAELVALEDNKTVVMRMANRKIARVPIDTLSTNDQSYVRKWWADNKDKLDPMDFVLKINRETEVVDRETSRSGGQGGGTDPGGGRADHALAPPREHDDRPATLVRDGLERAVGVDGDRVTDHLEHR